MDLYRQYPNEAHELLAGTIAGTAGVLVSLPFDLIKVRLQSGLSNVSPYQTGLTIVKNEGFFSLWRGVLPPIIANVPINAIGFATYGNAQRFLTPYFDKNTNSRSTIPQTPYQQQQQFYQHELLQHYTLPISFQRHITTPNHNHNDYITYSSNTTEQYTNHPNWWAVFYAGCWSGLLSCFVSTPAEFLKIQEQNFIGEKCPSSWVIARRLIAEHGPMSIFRGFRATVIRDSPSVGVYFLVYEYLKYVMRTEEWKPQVIVNGNIITPEQSRSLFTRDANNQNNNNINDDNNIKINWEYNLHYSIFASFLAGGIAGPVSWLSTYPIDVAKTNIQTLTHDEYKKTSLLKILRYIKQKHGMKFFATGLGTTLFQSFPVSGVIFLMYEYTLRLCRSAHNNSNQSSQNKVI